MNFLRRDTRSGFTIVELMVVSALIAILATLIVVNVKKYRMRARDNVRVEDIRVIRLALEQYKLACGEYPERLEPDVHNGCSYGQKLSDFLPHIPVAPSYGENPQYVSDPGDELYDSQVSADNTYLYAGLSNHPGGKCYDYHVGAILEEAVYNGASQNSHFLDEDHDAAPNKGLYKYKCRNSKKDFGDDDVSEADSFGLYDFRSQSSFAEQ